MTKQIWTAKIITQEFTCFADSEEEAEMKYDAYFNGEDCGCGKECICGEDDNVDHFWEEG